jgi:hypothetical protein
MRLGYGYGVYEVGQFQVVVGEYERTGEKMPEDFDVDGFLGGSLICRRRLLG